MWGVFTFYMWIASFRASLTVWLIFLLLWITFFLLAGGDLGMGMSWHTGGGYVGLLTGIAALYGSFAQVTNATWGREAIPLGGPVLKR
jgi:succinate-acetate transporter protein